jgi:hypothetical protein
MWYTPFVFALHLHTTYVSIRVAFLPSNVSPDETTTNVSHGAGGVTVSSFVSQDSTTAIARANRALSVNVVKNPLKTYSLTSCLSRFPRPIAFSVPLFQAAHIHVASQVLATSNTGTDAPHTILICRVQGFYNSGLHTQSTALKSPLDFSRAGQSYCQNKPPSTYTFEKHQIGTPTDTKDTPQKQKQNCNPHFFNTSTRNLFVCG